MTGDLCAGDMHGVQWWERWYAAGGDSGPGSRGAAAQWKADAVNAFVLRHQIKTLFEMGCGDGGQAALLSVPSYVGYDPSATAVRRARERVQTDQFNQFRWFTDRPNMGPRVDWNQRAELGLSMDVLYHLFDDQEREDYIATLFAVATRFVLIYTTRDSSHDYPGHVWHRPPPGGWTGRIEPPDPTNNCSFFVYDLARAA